MSNTNSKAVKAGIGYTIGNFFVKGLNFFTIPIFARLLSASDYGLYNTFIAYEGILFSVIGLALQMSLKNAKYTYGDDYGKYVSSILMLEVLLMFFWLIIVYLFKSLIYSISGYGYFLSSLLIVQCGASSILTLFNIHLSLNYYFKSYLIVTALNALLNIVISVLLIISVYNNERFIGRVLGTVIPLIILATFICFYFWRQNKPFCSIKYWRFGISYSLPLIPHAISQVILNQFDRVMINEMKGAVYAGIYSFAYNIFMIISVVMYSLDNVWSPWFYENYHNKRTGEIRNRSFQYALGMLIFSVVIMMISPEMIEILGTEEYFEAKYSVIPVCAGGYFMFLYSIPSQVEYYYGKTYFIALGTTLAAVLKIILNLYCIPCYGYISAAYTTELAFALYFIFHYFIAKKLAKERLFNGIYFMLLGGACVIVSLCCICCIDYWIIRWSIVLCMSLIVLVYLYRNGQLQIVHNYIIKTIK